MAGERGCAGGASAAAGAGELLGLLKSTTSPSAFLITIALLAFLGRSKVLEPGPGLAEVILGVWLCEMWFTFVIAGVEGWGTADEGRSEMLDGVRDML